MIKVEQTSDSDLTKDSSPVSLMGELWFVVHI